LFPMPRTCGTFSRTQRRTLSSRVDVSATIRGRSQLTASVFDGSADLHNISQGFFDPVKAATAADPYGGNVPYSIDGMSVADRVSFYYLSKCNLSEPGSTERVISSDIRAKGCNGDA